MKTPSDTFQHHPTESRERITLDSLLIAGTVNDEEKTHHYHIQTVPKVNSPVSPMLPPPTKAVTELASLFTLGWCDKVDSQSLTSILLLCGEAYTIETGGYLHG